MFRKHIIKDSLLIIIILANFQFTAFSQLLEKDTIKLFFLGGQSNMEGHGKISELPDSLRKEFNDVWIFQGNPMPDENINGGLGKWAALTPGHGAGFSSDGINIKLSNKFGIELSFANKLMELYPNEKVALIKYSRGGSSLDSLAAREY